MSAAITGICRCGRITRPMSATWSVASVRARSVPTSSHPELHALTVRRSASSSESESTRNHHDEQVPSCACTVARNRGHVLLSAAAHAADGSRPNILVIIADDLGSGGNRCVRANAAHAGIPGRDGIAGPFSSAMPRTSCPASLALLSMGCSACSSTSSAICRSKSCCGLNSNGVPGTSKNARNEPSPRRS